MVGRLHGPSLIVFSEGRYRGKFGVRGECAEFGPSPLRRTADAGTPAATVEIGMVAAVVVEVVGIGW